MKKLLLVTLCLFVFVGCEVVPKLDEKKSDEVSKIESGTKEVNKIPEVSIPVVNATEPRDYLFTASSTLVDDTNIGFNYEPAMVADGDFSTAWCRAKDDTAPSIVFDFSRPVKADKFGIVPGFARDEKIYKQNNRLKKISLVFDDVEAAPMSFDLKDEYGMQFVDLGGKEFSKVKLIVDDVYKGSKYDDTCISEWDFSSAYVQKGDATAALDYYVKEKKANALRPYDIVGKMMFSMDEPDKCNNPVRDYADPASAEMGYAQLWNLPVYLSAYVNEFGREGDKVEVRWYSDQLKLVGDNVVHQGYILEAIQKDVPVVKACDGKLYVHTSLSDFSNINLMLDGKDKVEIYSNGKFVGVEYFNLSQ